MALAICTGLSPRTSPVALVIQKLELSIIDLSRMPLCEEAGEGATEDS